MSKVEDRVMQEVAEMSGTANIRRADPEWLKLQEQGEGASFVGKLIEKSKQVFDETGSRGVYTLKDRTGRVVRIPGQTGLDNAMAGVDIGQIVGIIYKGEEQIDGGKKRIGVWEVFVPDHNKDKS